MIWKNRNFRKAIVAGILLIVVIFTLPVFWPVDAVWYYQNLNWLIPLIIIVFIAPMVPFFLSDWDIHFDFEVHDKGFVVTLTNAGTTSFNFSRVQFVSGKKYWVFGKRQFYPQKGIFDKDVEFHGADTPSQLLHEHIGCTLTKGMPITVTLRGPKIAEYLRHFEKSKGKVYMCLHYHETDQRACSQRIPVEFVKRIIETSSGS